MHCVIVEFQYGDDFDRAHVAEIAREARGRFEGIRKSAKRPSRSMSRTAALLTSTSGSPRTLRAGSLTMSWSRWSRASTVCVQRSRSARSPNSLRTGRSAGPKEARSVRRQPVAAPAADR